MRETHMRGLKDKRIVVVGGARGIGAATARRLTEEGARVVIGDINRSAMEATLAEIQAAGGDAIGLDCDIADEAAVNGFVERATAHLGGLDGAAIAAAATGGSMGQDLDLLHMDPRVWEGTMRVNLIGHALLMRAAVPHLTAAGGGAIVTISSGAAAKGNTTLPAYAASKAGLQALVRHVAHLCGKDNIRCNAVAPGLVLLPGQANQQDLIARRGVGYKLPRLGTGDDLAAAIAFLLSDDAAWITGQTISVNGGLQFRD
jgi:NAD(P)-dependent dehydrogenase (short-subunit alcohol dehydrogenase family)